MNVQYVPILTNNYIKLSVSISFVMIVLPNGKPLQRNVQCVEVLYNDKYNEEWGMITKYKKIQG